MHGAICAGIVCTLLRYTQLHSRITPRSVAQILLHAYGRRMVDAGANVDSVDDIVSGGADGMVLCAVMHRTHAGCIREPHQDCTDPGERTKRWLLRNYAKLVATR